MSPSQQERRRQIGLHPGVDQGLIMSPSSQPTDEVISVKTLLDRKLAALMSQSNGKGKKKSKRKKAEAKKPEVVVDDDDDDDWWGERDKAAEATTNNEEAKPEATPVEPVAAIVEASASVNEPKIAAVPEPDFPAPDTKEPAASPSESEAAELKSDFSGRNAATVTSDVADKKAPELAGTVIPNVADTATPNVAAKEAPEPAQVSTTETSENSKLSKKVPKKRKSEVSQWLEDESTAVMASSDSAAGDEPTSDSKNPAKKTPKRRKTELEILLEDEGLSAPEEKDSHAAADIPTRSRKDDPKNRKRSELELLQDGEQVAEEASQATAAVTRATTATVKQPSAKESVLNGRKRSELELLLDEGQYEAKRAARKRVDSLERKIKKEVERPPPRPLSKSALKRLERKPHPDGNKRSELELLLDQGKLERARGVKKRAAVKLRRQKAKLRELEQTLNEGGSDAEDTRETEAPVPTKTTISEEMLYTGTPTNAASSEDKPDTETQVLTNTARNETTKKPPKRRKTELEVLLGLEVADDQVQQDATLVAAMGAAVAESSSAMKKKKELEQLLEEEIECGEEVVLDQSARRSARRPATPDKIPSFFLPPDRNRPLRVRSAKLLAPETGPESAPAPFRYEPTGIRQRAPRRRKTSSVSDKPPPLPPSGDEEDDDEVEEITSSDARVAKQIVTGGRVAEWTAKFKELKQFKKKYGHCQAPKAYDFPLSQWVSTQRLNLKNYKISAYKTERVELLLEVGFFWGDNHPCGELIGAVTTSAIQTFDDLWMNTFAKLRAFKKDHGHCNVPMGHDKALSCWVRGQRALLRDDLGIKKERIRNLNSIHFDWGKNHPFTKNKTSVTRGGPGPKQAEWMKQFRKLKKFHAKWGNCKVPWTYHDSALQLWARSQRRTIRDFTGYRKKRADLLNSLDFDWGDDHPFNLKPSAEVASPVAAVEEKESDEDQTPVRKFKKWSRPNKIGSPPKKRPRKRR